MAVVGGLAAGAADGAGVEATSLCARGESGGAAVRDPVVIGWP